MQTSRTAKKDRTVTQQFRDWSQAGIRKRLEAAQLDQLIGFLLRQSDRLLESTRDDSVEQRNPTSKTSRWSLDSIGHDVAFVQFRGLDPCWDYATFAIISHVGRVFVSFPTEQKMECLEKLVGTAYGGIAMEITKCS